MSVHLRLAPVVRINAGVMVTAYLIWLGFAATDTVTEKRTIDMTDWFSDWKILLIRDRDELQMCARQFGVRRRDKYAKA